MAAAGLAVASLAACGSSSSTSTGSQNHAAATQSIPLEPGENAAAETLGQGQRGGTLTGYTSEDFQHLDPG